MRKVLRIIWGWLSFILPFSFSAKAQEPAVTGSLHSTFQASLFEYDTALTVLCAYEDIHDYIFPRYHHDPDGRYWNDSRHHPCVGDNARACSVYLARLEKLSNPANRHKRPSYDAEKIICNFEQLTGVKNSSQDGDFFGPVYISSLALQGWRHWYEENKDHLRFCSKHHVLYSTAPIPTR